MLRVNLVYQALPEYRVAPWRALARRPGIDLTVHHATWPDLPNAQPDGFRAVPIREFSPDPHRVVLLPRLLGLASRSRSDVLVAPWNLRSAFLLPALARARASGVGTVLWGHGYSKRERPLKRWLRDRQGRLADALVFYDRATCRSFSAQYPGYRGAFVAPNTLDLGAIEAARARANASPERSDALRAALGLTRADATRRPLVALHVGRLVEDNGVDLLLEASAGLDGVRTLIVGDGPRRPELERRAADLGVRDDVRFLGAEYDSDRLALLFSLADVFVYPRNVGLSAVHALAHGLPVVVGDHLPSHNPEVHAVQHGVNGALFSQDDAGALAEVLRGLRDGPATLEAMSTRALASVHRDLPLEAMVDGLEAAVRFAAARRGRSPDAG